MWPRRTPSNNRDWSFDQRVLSYAVINGNEIHIYNIRNCTYKSEHEYEVHYYDKVFNINELKRFWFALVPFSRIKGVAHALVSFEFEENNYVALSVEVRKKRDEEFSTLKSFFSVYELMYVVGDENDLIKLRSNFRHELVHLYPLKVPQRVAQAFFLDMLARLNQLRDHPEFFNSIINSCTSNLIRHANHVAPQSIPWRLYNFFPKTIDKLLLRLGFIDSTLPLKELRQKHLINDRAQKYPDSKDFSTKIRNVNL